MSKTNTLTLSLTSDELEVLIGLLRDANNNTNDIDHQFYASLLEKVCNKSPI